MIINRIYETQNLLSLQLVSFLVGLWTYQHPCMAKVLWADSLTERGKISGVRNQLNSAIYSIYTIYKCARGPYNTTWRTPGSMPII